MFKDDVDPFLPNQHQTKSASLSSKHIHNSKGLLWTGASIPLWGHDAFPPCFRFPLCFRNVFWLSGKFLKSYLFPTKFPIFICQNFWRRPFFSHQPQISNFPPISPVWLHFPPDSQKFLIPPTFQNFPLCFRKIQQLFTYFTCISPPTLTMMHLCITQCTYWTPLDGEKLANVRGLRGLKSVVGKRCYFVVDALRDFCFSQWSDFRIGVWPMWWKWVRKSGVRKKWGTESGKISGVRLI